MKEITISEGVKLVIDEGCDVCREQEDEIVFNRKQLQSVVNILQGIEARHPKAVRNNWDTGYNQCLADIKKYIKEEILN